MQYIFAEILAFFSKVEYLDLLLADTTKSIGQTPLQTTFKILMLYHFKLLPLLSFANLGDVFLGMTEQKVLAYIVEFSLTDVMLTTA